MWENKLFEKLLVKHKDIDFETYNESLQSTNYYHVLVHDSAYEEFWECLNKQDIVILKIQSYPKFSERGDHLHICIGSKEPFKNSCSGKIISFPIKNEADRKTLNDKIFNVKQHSRCCFVTFSNLQQKCIRVILDTLPHVSKAKELILSKCLKRKVFEENKFYYVLTSEEAGERADNFDLSQIDKVYSRSFVASCQNSDNIELQRALCGALTVSFSFVSSDFKHFKLCSECMEIEKQNGDYCREYHLLEPNNPYYMEYYVRSPDSWCFACKRVALFQILNDRQFSEEYPHTLRNHGFRNLYCRCYPGQRLLKRDFFENGVKIKSLYGCRLPGEIY